MLRFNPDGSLDSTFQTDLQWNAVVLSIVNLPDGKVLAAGRFQTVGDQFRDGIARFTSDGALDPTFTPTMAYQSVWVYDLALQPDGKVLVAGTLQESIAPNRQKGIIRLNVNGSLDTSFDTGDLTYPVEHVTLLQGGKVLLGGLGYVVNGTTTVGVTRLNADGSLETEFATEDVSFSQPQAYQMVEQPDGKIVVGGYGPFGPGNAQRNQMLTRLSGSSSKNVGVRVKAQLEGADDVASSLMRHDLRTAGLIPSLEPYTSLGIAYYGEGGREQVAPGSFTGTANDLAVDWVLLELRSASAPQTVVATRAALLQRDGDVVDLRQDTFPVFFPVEPGNYYVAVRHRNHLGCMTASPLQLSAQATTVDFTLSSTQTWGMNARKDVGGIMMLWAGNADFNHDVKYTGSLNDRDPILVRVGSTTPNNTVSGYWREDVNMNGQVQYTGSGNDRDPILVNVGSTTPNNVRIEQLP